MYYVFVENGCSECAMSPHVFGIYERREDAYDAAYAHIDNPLFGYIEQDRKDLKIALPGNKENDIVPYEDEGEDHSLRILEVPELNTFYDIMPGRMNDDDSDSNDNLIELEDLKNDRS